MRISNIKYVVAQLLGAIVIVAVAGCGGGEPASATGEATVTTQDTAENPAGRVSGTETGAASLADLSPFGFHPARVTRKGYPDSGYTDAQNIGVNWTREGVYAFWFIAQPDLSSQQYDFSMYDAQWGAVPDGMRILANIAPQADLRDEGRLQPGTWLPVDEAKYAAFVMATVERYDGDGTADMTNLKNPIKYWQVGNEPDETRRTGFAQLQKISYEAIKQACSDCQVLIGGVPGMPGDYIGGFDKGYAPILAQLGGKYVDIFDFHWYGKATGDYRFKDVKTGKDVLDHIRGTLKADGFAEDMPIWIAEMGSYSGDPVEVRGRGLVDFPEQSERQQAGDYFRRFIYSLSRGVDKVFPAFGLLEGFKHDGGYFDHTGLIYDGEGTGDPGFGVKKLGYYTYKKMTESLGGADWTTLRTLQDGTGSDHLYLFEVNKDGQSVYIAWWDYFDEPGYAVGKLKNITVAGLPGGEAQVTAVVPAATNGQAVTGYSQAFSSRTVPVVDGTATVPLGEDPVIIMSGGTGT